MNTLPNAPLNSRSANDTPARPSHPEAKAHAEHVIRLARQLADGSRPGVLATIDTEGTPQLRWMATLSLDHFPHLYALTSPRSRKIEQIRKHPAVSWMFTSDSSNTVVHLSGTATIVTDPSVVNGVWRMIEDKSNAYFLALATDGDGIAVIDTLIEDIDCVIPKYGLHYPPRQAELPAIFPDKPTAKA